MSRSHAIRGIRYCKICGEGFDAFKARDARGRYCSPACLVEARRRHRQGMPLSDEPDALVGPATLPMTISLGSRNSIVTLGPDPSVPPGDDRRLV